MPLQIGIEVTGTTEGIIFYKSRNKYLIRSKGNTGRQAPVAKEQAGILGKASAISAKLRKELRPIIPSSNSRDLMYKLNNILQQWLRSREHEQTMAINNIELLQRFSFNTLQNDFYIAMPVSRADNNELLLHIPALDSPNPIHPLPFNGQVRLHVIAACCNIHNPADITAYERLIEINYRGIPIAAQTVRLPLQTRAGCLTVTGLMINETESGVIGGMYN